MKIKGIIKKSFKDKTGIVWKNQPIKCNWDGKDTIVTVNAREIQITDCKSTFESAKNECIFVEETVKAKKKGDK